MYAKLFFFFFFSIAILLNYMNCRDEFYIKFKFQNDQNNVLVTNICDEFSLDGKSKWNDDQLNRIMDCFINNEIVNLVY